MPPPKKKKSTLHHIVRLTPEPPDIQDVLDEIEDIKGTLDLIQYSIQEIKRKIDDLPEELERS